MAPKPAPGGKKPAGGKAPPAPVQRGVTGLEKTVEQATEMLAQAAKDKAAAKKAAGQ